MRRVIDLTATLLFLLAVATPAAAKPVPPGDAPAAPDPRAPWRGQAVAVCVDRLHAIPDLGPDDLESICGCGADGVLQSNIPLPPVAGGRVPPAMQGRLIACTGRARPEQASAVARLLADAARTPPPATETPVIAGKPTGDEDAAPPETEGDSGGGFWSWVSSLSLPAWLTGASLLLWVALGILVFGVIALTIRRRDPRKDLTGPPSYMQKGAPAQPPRRPDLPR